MSKVFKLQDPGEGIREAEILAVLVSEGDAVSEGDPIFEVETDKATMEVHADFSGTIDEIRVNEGSVAQVGEVLITYEAKEAGQADDKEKAQAEDKEKAQADGKEKAQADDKDDASERPKSDKKAQTKSTQGKREGDESPDAEQEPQAEAAPSERQEDDKNQRSRSGEQQASERSDRSESSNAKDDHESKRGREDAQHADEGTSSAAHPGPAAAPSTRRLARELDVDLNELEGGSGPHGRITDDDVKAAAGSGSETADGEDTSDDRRATKQDETGDEAADHTQSRSTTEAEEERREPLRGIRRATARQMTRSWQVPHVMHHDLATIDELLKLRQEHTKLSFEAAGEDQVKPTLTSYLVKAVASALRRHPNFNARLDTDEDEIVTLATRHIGVAVSTERGLFVPVLRDVERRSLADVARELKHLSARAREGKLESSEMRGASTTLTNVGSIGGRSFTPIINAPQSSILGVGAAFEEYVPDENRQPMVVTRLPLSFAFDHRLNDGAQAARFVNTIKQILSGPAAFSLLV